MVKHSSSPNVCKINRISREGEGGCRGQYLNGLPLCCTSTLVDDILLHVHICLLLIQVRVMGTLQKGRPNTSVTFESLRGIPVRHHKGPLTRDRALLNIT